MIHPWPLWTLVLVGPNHGDWGFWREGQFIPWRVYIYGTETDR